MEIQNIQVPQRSMFYVIRDRMDAYAAKTAKVGYCYKMSTVARQR
jgi:hypothetical protein